MHTADLLRRLAPGASRSIYSYHDDFQILWSAVEALRADRASPISNDAYIIWDDVPPVGGVSQFRFRDFLTIYDWAAAATVAASRPRVLERGVDNRVPPLRINVLDLTRPQQWPRSHSVRMAPLVATLAPWLKVFSLHEPSALAFLRSIRLGIEDDRPSFDKFMMSADGQDAAELICRLWRSELTRPEDRHSVSNAIGPAALFLALNEGGHGVASSVLQGLVGPPSDPRRTFWHLLETLELLPSLQDSGLPLTTVSGPFGGLINEAFVKEDLFGQFRRLRFGLVDDQAAAGFHTVLAAFLLGPDATPVMPTPKLHAASAPTPPPTATSEVNIGGHVSRLSSFSTPDILLRWLQITAQRQEGKPWYKPRIFGRSSGAGPDKEPIAPVQFDILFLDLRLDDVGDADRQEGTKWTRALLDFYASHEVQIEDEERRFDGARVAALTTAVRAARRYASAPPGTHSQLAHLALLPILISVCDPTMPIILFSSTRQQPVLELLKPFPNIIVRPSKPAVTGYEDDTDNLRQAGNSLRRSLREAFVLHEKRALWSLVRDFELSDSTPVACALHIDGHQTVVHNVGNTSLPFSNDRQYDLRLFHTVKEYILERQKYAQYLFHPFEMIESALLNELRSSNEEKKYELSFPLKKQINESTLSEEIKKDKIDKGQIVLRIKKIRDMYAHGRLIPKKMDPDALRAACQLVFVFLYCAISNRSLKELHSDLCHSLLKSKLAQDVLRGRDVIVVGDAPHEQAVTEILLEAWQFQKRKVARWLHLRAEYRAGREMFDGVVTSTNDAGAWVDLGDGVSGFLHRSGRFAKGEKVSVRIKNFNAQNGRIELARLSRGLP